MKRGVSVVSVLMLFAVVVFASPVVEGPSEALTGDELIIMPADAIGWTPQPSVLDVIIGDTIHIGTTGWDGQHNAGVGRMIGYTNEGNGTAHFVWSKLYGLNATDARHVVHCEATGDGMGGYTVTTAVSVENGYRSGYANLPYNAADDKEYPVFHYAPTSTSGWGSYAFIENPFVPGLYSNAMNPDVFANLHIWPHGVYSPGYVHTVSHEQRVGNSDLMQISYMRWAVNDVTGQLTAATATGNPVLLTSDAMNISADVVTNDTGDKVAVGAVMGRLGTIGEDWLEPGEDDQWNNDLWVFQSSDGGSNWDAGTDITGFISPNPNALPDTLAANGDTMRAYSDCSVVFDDEDDLHVAFTAGLIDWYRQSIFYESRIYHWMEDDQGNDVYTMINHQPFRSWTETWGRTTDRPSLYFDDDSGILWCVMEVADFGPDTTDWGQNATTDWYMGNTDIFVSASPPGEYNGLLWTTPVNVTNTMFLEEGGAPAGECQSESDPSIALNSDGDNLHIMYVLDLDAGTGVATEPEGTITDNPVVYHVIPKVDMIAEFDSWLVNYPMHVDGTGFWEDPGNYEWETYGGFYTTNRDNAGPVTLTLTGVNTTVPAAGGNVTYTASLVSTLGNTFPGVLYWTRATLPNGQQTGVLFQLPFTVTPFMDVTAGPLAQAIPGYAPEGSYTYTGYVGYWPNPVLQDSFEFTKLGAATDGEFDPADWPHSGDYSLLTGDATETLTTNLPTDYALNQAYPNPFNAMTTVTIALPEVSELTVTVFNTLGQEVAQLANGQASAGTHTLTFDASNLSSGIYFIQATVPGKLDALQKVALVK